jgi:hypothetical protein
MGPIAKVSHVTRTQAVWTLRIGVGAWLSAALASIALSGQDVLAALINSWSAGFVFGTFTLVWLAPRHRRDVV